MENGFGMTNLPTEAQAERLRDAIERARNHKMTPQEIFEQRVSFVSEGRNKDEVRRMLIEKDGYPAEASEREAIVNWLREQYEKGCAIAAEKPPHSDSERNFVAAAVALQKAAEMIERGDHLK